MFKRTTLILGLGAATLVIAAAGAWACTNLATLNTAQASAMPGETVTITGTSFKAIEEGVTPVTIHWNAVNGDVLAQVEPDSSGAISASITVPSDASAGQYVLVATQRSADPGHGLEAADDAFEPIFGTPARAPLMVGSPTDVGPADVGPQPVATPPASGSGSLLLVSGLLALGAFGLFAGAATLLGREAGRRTAGTPAPVQDRGRDSA